jgi:hypothetical protein
MTFGTNIGITSSQVIVNTDHRSLTTVTCSRLLFFMEEMLRVSVQDVLNCSFSAWYPLFEKYTLKRYDKEIFVQ